MKTIIIFSTKYGSVEKAAMKLKSHLKWETEVVNVKSNPDFSGYDVVILGGSVYAGNVQKEMRRFLRNNLPELSERKIGLFICAGTDKEETITSYLIKNFSRELYNRAIARANLGYEYDLKKFSFFDRLIVRIVGVKKSESVFYEDKIREFAEKINDL